jgi:hypothetical protein
MRALKRTNRYDLRAGIYLACYLLIGGYRVFAWGSFAHYQGAPAGLHGQINLPDIAPSRGQILLDLEVTEWFGWGHCCQRMGVTNVGPVVIPMTPTSYGSPAGIELAEWDMYILYQKMSAEHRASENGDMILQTARGWLAHNVMDSFVHFSYFLGGTANNWLVQHGTKESWADYELFAIATGYPTEPWGSYIHGMRASGHGGIICLAQKCFRKNRQTVDGLPPIAGVPAPGPVESRVQNDGRISGQDSYLRTTLFTEDDYSYYCVQAAVNGWTVGPMLGLHAIAAASATTAVGSMP